MQNDFIRTQLTLINRLAKDTKSAHEEDWALGVMMFRFLTGFWFERANREKCLALLVDCELPWRQLFARLCAETPGGRVPERGFVSLAEGLCPSDSNRTIRGSRWLKRSIWGVASICVLAFLVAIVKTAVIVPLDKINDEDSIDYVEAVLKREASWV